MTVASPSKLKNPPPPKAAVVCALALVIIPQVLPLIIAVIALLTSACGMGSKSPVSNLPPWKLVKDANGVEMRLLEKAPYTYLYALDGTLRQMKFDSDGDRRPDVFAYFSGGNTPDRLEIDENRDGTIDRWEEYNADGVMLRYAISRKGGVPERFVEIDPVTKATVQVETDADRNGTRERLELFVGGKLTRAEIDSDGNGKRDRFQDWRPGYLLTEEIDRDNDGRPDIRITHSRSGAILRFERLTQ